MHETSGLHPHLQTRRVEFPVEGGTTASGYEARPAGAGSYPGVLVIHEWWGVNEHIQDIARRLAGEGFVALVPDLYGGKLTSNPIQAAAFMEALDREAAVRILLGALRFLQEKEPIYAEHIGVIGFCMGGSYTLLLACRAPSLKVAVAFYGDHPDPLDQLANIRCPVLFIAAGRDQWISPAKVDKLKKAFEQYKVHAEVRVYPDAGHAFFNDTRPEVYNPAAAQDAWTRALGLLSRTLKS
ncbi:MAG: dienelactone hydrolase family protein [Acidobacteria bacterium]|nr:dienelactone hydrolase family protein [Acidobacteriota bacterium]